MVKVCGIDPGKDGALAIGDLDVETGLFSDIMLFDMPMSSAGDQELFGRPLLDSRTVVAILRTHNPDFVIVEHVGPDRKWGASPAWTFATGFGALVSSCQTAFGPDDRRLVLISVQKWKNKFGLSSDKEQSLALVRQMFPSVRVGRHDEAEALILLASWRDIIIPTGGVEVL